MITCVVIIGRTCLHPVRIETLRNIIASVTFLAGLGIARIPDKLLRACHGAVIFLHDLNALTQPVVSELAAVRSAGSSGESIQWVPFKRARAVASQVSIGVIDQSFTATPGDSHIIV